MSQINKNVWFSRLKIELFYLIILIFLGLVLRLNGFMTRSLWWDEFVSIDYANLDFPMGIIHKVHTNVNPPLFYLLLSIWIKIFGQDDMVLRSLPLIFALGSIPLFYLVMKNMLNANTALLATLFLVLNPFHIFYSVEVRMYALMVFFTLASAWSFQKWVETPRTEYAVCLITFNVTALYLHYFFIPFLIAQNAYFLVFRKMFRGKTLKLVMIQLLTMIFFLPWIPAIIYQYKGPVYGHFRKLDLNNLLLFVKQISPGACALKGYPDPISWILVIILVIMGTIAVIFSYKKSHFFQLPSILAYFYVPILIVWIQSFSKPSFTQRNMIVLVPFFLALIAIGINWIKYSKARIVVTTIIVIFNVFSLWNINSWHRDYNFRGDWKQAANILKNNVNNEDIVLLYPGQLHSWGITYYFPVVDPLPHVYEPIIKTVKRESNDQLIKKISEKIKTNSIIWFVVCGDRAYNRWKTIVPLLDEHYNRLDLVKLFNVRIYKYSVISSSIK